MKTIQDDINGRRGQNDFDDRLEEEIKGSKNPKKERVRLMEKMSLFIQVIDLVKQKGADYFIEHCETHDIRKIFFMHEVVNTAIYASTRDLSEVIISSDKQSMLECLIQMNSIILSDESTTIN